MYAACGIDYTTVLFPPGKKIQTGNYVERMVCLCPAEYLVYGYKAQFSGSVFAYCWNFSAGGFVQACPLKADSFVRFRALPSGLVILWQNAVLFGESTGNGIAFQPWYTFSLHANITKLAVVCSLLFCICAVAVMVKQLACDADYRFIVLMSVLGFLEALCLVESGNRSVDGNFLWGYSFCLFVLFAVCAVKWLQLGKTKLQGALRVGLGLLYGWHLYCGLYSVVNLVAGASYWME